MPKKREYNRSRQEVMLVRLSKAEKSAFRDSARISGLPVSAWARERLMRAAIKDLETVGKTPQFITDAET
jgi:hypothetical protein